MKKVIGNCIFTSHNAKESRMLNKLEKIMNPPAPKETPKRYKVVFRTKKGVFYRIIDSISALDASVSTGVKQDQIISVEQVGCDVRCTPNKPFVQEVQK